jgi:hypothetical protein
MGEGEMPSPTSPFDT